MPPAARRRPAAGACAAACCACPAAGGGAAQTPSPPQGAPGRSRPSFSTHGRGSAGGGARGASAEPGVHLQARSALLRQNACSPADEQVSVLQSHGARRGGLSVRRVPWCACVVASMAARWGEAGRLGGPRRALALGGGRRAAAPLGPLGPLTRRGALSAAAAALGCGAATPEQALASVIPPQRLRNRYWVVRVGESYSSIGKACGWRVCAGWRCTARSLAAILTPIRAPDQGTA